jgi:hypothetical protein
LKNALATPRKMPGDKKTIARCTGADNAVARLFAKGRGKRRKL